MKAKRVYLAMLFAMCIAVLSGVVIVGCGGDKGSDPAPVNEVNIYLQSLPDWEDFAEVAEVANVDSGDVVPGDMLAEMSNQVLCTTIPYSITQNPENVVSFGQAPDMLWPGALIQGNSYLGGLGSIEDIPITQRAPLVIAINIISGTDVTRTIANPTSSSVWQAVTDIVTEAENGGYQTARDFYYDYKQSYSSTQAALSLGISYKSLGTAGKVALAFTSSEETNTVTAFFKEVMFEVYIERPQTPTGFFTADFTKERLDEQIAQGNIGPNNLPVYVSRIQYGRMLIYSMTSSNSMEAMKLAAKASYSGFASYSAEMQAEVQNILNTAEIKIAQIGGDYSDLEDLLKDGDLSSYFGTVVPLTTAKPLGYALVNLADGSLAKVSETTSYDVRECSGANAEVYLNKSEWQQAVAALAGDGLIREMLTTAENLTLANEVSNPPVPNQGMGQILTFDSSATGYPFIFDLMATRPGYNLVFDDQENGPGFSDMDQQRSISIGDIDNDENDNFAIHIIEWQPNCAVFAIGITVGNNEVESDEQVQVKGINNFIKLWNNEDGDVIPSCPSSIEFLGFVSTVPITDIWFNEGNDGDDIFVRDFCFGVLEWTD